MAEPDLARRPHPSEGAFYVGYGAEAPPALMSFVRRRTLALIVALLAVAVALVLDMRGFSTATFEYGDVRSFTGVLREHPYPMLLVARPGVESDRPQPKERGPEGDRSSARRDPASHSAYLLVGEGKHGANSLVEGLDGESIRLRGTLIHHEGRTMVEVVANSVERASDGPPIIEHAPPRSRASAPQTVTLVGEIVDSKCFLGVMKPGHLKPHRACATRCIAGGIPPILIVRGEDGLAEQYLLVDAEGGTVNERVLDLVAERVSITGQVRREGELSVLYADPAAYRRVD